jgi:hypothetical protein
MVGLEIESTFAFQSGKWLGDVAPHLLTANLMFGLADAKRRATIREALESSIPKHLHYQKGWPTCMPSYDEARLLATVRKEMGEIMKLPVKFTTAQEVTARYAQLMAQRLAA